MRHLRRLVPESGPPYELFNLAVLIASIAWFGYVVGKPASYLEDALAAPLAFGSDTAWGIGGVACCVFAIFTAYLSRIAPQCLRWGYGLLIAAMSFWLWSLLYGVVVAGAGDRAVVSVMIYGFLVRQLVVNGWGRPR